MSNNDEKAFYRELNNGTKYLVDDLLSSSLECFYYPVSKILTSIRALKIFHTWYSSHRKSLEYVITRRRIVAIFLPISRNLRPIYPCAWRDGNDKLNWRDLRLKAAISNVLSVPFIPLRFKLMTDFSTLFIWQFNNSNPVSAGGQMCNHGHAFLLICFYPLTVTRSKHLGEIIKLLN